MSQVDNARLLIGLLHGKGGMPVLRGFPFAFDTPNLLTGAALYTPTPGDLLLAVGFRVTAAWDGTTPHLAAVSVGGQPYGGSPGAAALPANTNSADAWVSAAGPAVEGAGFGFYPPLVTTQPTFPTVFRTSTPIGVLVSSNGVSLTPQVAFVNASFAPPTIPTTVTAGVNDQFTLDGNTYVVAPGTYTTIVQLADAMLAASFAGAPLSARVGALVYEASGPAPAMGETYFALAASTGTDLNGVAFGTGTHDFLAASGFADGDAFAGGTVNGGDPGSTQGEAILYLVTATPESQ